MAPERSDRGRRVAAVIVAIIVTGIVAFSLGRLSAPVASAPSNLSIEAGFARDMQTHHDQAVELSFIIRDETSDPEVRLLAYDIARSQSQQSGQMYGWLAAWRLPQAAAEPSMTWMTRPTREGEAGHAHGASDSAHTPGDPMPGLATAQQVSKLQSLTGVPAERYFLELMIAHHTGGVEMANALLDRSTESTATALAQSVVTAQSSEITLMKSLLRARGGA